MESTLVSQTGSEVGFCLDTTGLMSAKREANVDKSGVRHFHHGTVSPNAGVSLSWKQPAGIDTCRVNQYKKGKDSEEQNSPHTVAKPPHHGESKACRFVSSSEASAGSLQLLQLPRHSPACLHRGAELPPGSTPTTTTVLLLPSRSSALLIGAG